MKLLLFKGGVTAYPIQNKGTFLGEFFLNKNLVITTVALQYLKKKYLDFF